MEIILYDDVLPKLVCFSLSNFVKIICTVKPRYNAVSGRQLLEPRYKRGAL